MSALPACLGTLAPDAPVVIAGPTASGKSALALRLAEMSGGCIVNADALQVYAHWRVLTARPTGADLARAPHALYGHVARDAPYSVGHWLRDVRALLGGPERPIFVGGTGLYLSALTQGLAEIPQTPPDVRADAMARAPEDLLADLDPATRARIDTANPARIRRAWEVLRATGRGLAEWQDATPPPLLPAARATCIVIDAPKDVLSPRLAARFDAMLADGALDEVREAAPAFDPARPGDRAIGALELMAYLRGEANLSQARDAAIVATRQYAKRQRTWFRARMSDWTKLPLASL